MSLLLARIAAAHRGGGGTTDPYFADVGALLHFDAADGSQTFTDQTGRTWSYTGGPQITNSTSKFGIGSLTLFSTGDSDSIYTSHSAMDDFGSGDFTVEYWINNINSYSSNYRGIICSDDTAGTRGWNMFRDVTTTYVQFACFAGATLYLVSDTSAPPSGFTHFAACRDGGTLRLYRAGVQVASTAISGTINDTTNDLRIGALTTSGGVNTTTQYRGQIDEVRTTKGVCRYPGGTTFTPPTAAFPNS